MKKIKVLFFLLFFIYTPLVAETIDISGVGNISLLEHSAIYIDKEHLSLDEIRDRNVFQPYGSPQMNLGISTASIWIKLELYNDHFLPINRALVVRSSRLAHATLYDDDFPHKPVYKGLANLTGTETTRFPKFNIFIPPYSYKIVFLEIHDAWNTIIFTVTSQKQKEHHLEEQEQQRLILFLLGMIFSLMLYSFVLSAYTRDKSYLYYSLYLLTVLYQQSSYLGINHLYFPPSFIDIDRKLALFKIGLMLITSSLFAIYFLKTKSIKILHYGYIAGILMGIIKILFVGLVWYFSLSEIESIVKLFVASNFLYTVFSLIAAGIYYKNGNKEARLYIIGFAIVFIAYVLMAASALGFCSFMLEYPNIVIYATTIEALVLSLAFADRYNILQQSKELTDYRLLTESKNREKLIQKEVITKTAQLNQALEVKSLLLLEVHHRVKNNLQIILSIIRLQQHKLTNSDTIDKFIDLENRINAIAKTYDMLLVGDDLEEINMEDYIEALLTDIDRTMGQNTDEIEIIMDIKTTIPLRESVYIGLIVNELVTNAYKYAFDNNKGTIKISLSQKGREVTLIVEDDGKGFVQDNDSSLGLKLMQTLVSNQLKGSMEAVTTKHSKFIIRFQI